MAKSINNKFWRQKKLNEHYIHSITQNYGVSELLARMLSLKVSDLKDVENFLSPKIKNTLPDPFHLLDMEIAVSRIIKSIINQEKVYIFGDYDVDGATSSALLKNLFRELGLNVNIYIPDRIIEGYGPNIPAFQKFKAAGADLVITVDCGTASFAPLKLAKDIGLDVIVVDHHLSKELPEAIAIINPNRLDEMSDCTNLAAVGVSFLLAVALINKLKQIDFFIDRPVPNLMNYLDLVALGTVCDMMSLTELNRSFVSAGINIMKARNNIGIKTLIEFSNITDTITPYHLGFVLGPRINACGRVGKPHLGATLLSTTSESEAREICAELNLYNDERKIIEEQMLIDALTQAEQSLTNNCLIVANENWHRGVIGIIAAKLKEKYQKPSIAISIDGNISRGSCRSIKNVDLGSKIIKAKEMGLLIDGGGHAMAAAFTIETNKLDEFQNFLNDAIKNEFENTLLNDIDEYDLELSSNSISHMLINELNKLEPYGNGNAEPLVKLSELYILRADVLCGKHIKCLLAPTKKSYGSKAIKSIIFNSIGSVFEPILLNNNSKSMSFIGNLKINNWQNTASIELNIKDIII